MTREQVFNPKISLACFAQYSTWVEKLVLQLN
ncbi:hypothetical protein P5673_011851 [Acropora cervicornis]|uniref:Uncharacterized protein n=1 Tax=Acropora cervicornis TaxID=6130 RepID=A0AAD9V7R2_ACRCE|nr:hypothetical protein P5673_011851 [Acropora cervicornis]